MKTVSKTIIVTKNDHAIFNKLIENSDGVDPIGKKSLAKLYEELKSAKIVDESEFPNNTVRLNSIVTIETSFGKKDGMKLVLPSEGDLSKRKLSIMTPMGTALIGYTEGDKVIWSLPRGEEIIRIVKVTND